MPVEIADTIDRAREDPDEIERVFKLAKQYADEREQLRNDLEKAHDDQFVKIIMGFTLAILTGIAGVLLTYGFNIVEIGIVLMTVGSAFITALVMAFVKKYIPTLTKPLSEAFKVAGKEVPKDGTDSPSA